VPLAGGPRQANFDLRTSDFADRTPGPTGISQGQAIDLLIGGGTVLLPTEGLLRSCVRSDGQLFGTTGP
jgi:hypothetical protein